MTKIQIAGATTELAEALREENIDPKDWFEDCDKVNDALWTAGLSKIGLDWLSTPYSGSIHVGYYSDKIGFRILLDTDMSLEYETVEEMAEQLVAYNDQARMLEAKLPSIRIA